MEDILKEININLEISKIKVFSHSESNKINFNKKLNYSDFLFLEKLFNEEPLQISTRVSMGWFFKLKDFLKKNNYIYLKDENIYFSKKKNRTAFLLYNTLFIKNSSNKIIKKVYFKGIYTKKINWLSFSKN